MTPTKLRVLCLHSFRTSAVILSDQLAMAGWGDSQCLGDLCEFVYMDAPHPASGPIPPDVAGFFQPPYFEWWHGLLHINLNESSPFLQRST